MKKSTRRTLQTETKTLVKKVSQQTIYLRLIAGFLLLLSLAGFLLPLFRLTATVSLSGPWGGNLVILPANTEVTSLTARDLAANKKLPQLTLFGREIDRYQIGGYSVYQLLKTPLQNYGYLDTATTIISPQTAALLTNPQLQAAITKYFPEQSQNINALLQSAATITTEISQVLTVVNDLVVGLRQQSTIVSNTLTQIDTDLQTATFVTWLVLILIVAAIVLLFFPKLNSRLSLILTAIATSVVSLVIAAILIANQFLHTWVVNLIAQANHQLDSIIKQIFQQLLGENIGLLNLLGATNSQYLHGDLQLFVGSGAFIIFIGLVGSLITLIFLAWKTSSPHKR